MSPSRSGNKAALGRARAVARGAGAAAAPPEPGVPGTRREDGRKHLPSSSLPFTKCPPGPRKQAGPEEGAWVGPSRGCPGVRPAGPCRPGVPASAPTSCENLFWLLSVRILG